MFYILFFKKKNFWTNDICTSQSKLVFHQIDDGILELFYLKKKHNFMFQSMIRVKVKTIVPP